MSPAPIPVPMPQMASPQSLETCSLSSMLSGAGMGQLLQKANAQDSDMKQIVSNLSAQISETNKVLAKVAQSLEEITRLQNVTFVALHHLYLSSPYAQSAGEQGKNAKLFAQYLEQFVPKQGRRQRHLLKRYCAGRRPNTQLPSVVQSIDSDTLRAMTVPSCWRWQTNNSALPLRRILPRAKS